jgi:hypothetical protein
LRAARLGVGLEMLTGDDRNSYENEGFSDEEAGEKAFGDTPKNG